MSGSFFVDTNILIYSYTTSDSSKQSKAREIISQESAWISTQVIQEFINILRKKFSLDWLKIESGLKEVFENFLIHINSPQTIQKACTLAHKYGYSFYDSVIISAAIERECKILYSVDMQHGQVLEEKLMIINPFKG